MKNFEPVKVHKKEKSKDSDIGFIEISFWGDIQWCASESAKKSGNEINKLMNDNWMCWCW